jgi:hypothetical protein
VSEWVCVCVCVCVCVRQKERECECVCWERVVGCRCHVSLTASLAYYLTPSLHHCISTCCHALITTESHTLQCCLPSFLCVFFSLWLLVGLLCSDSQEQGWPQSPEQRTRGSESTTRSLAIHRSECCRWVSVWVYECMSVFVCVRVSECVCVCVRVRKAVLTCWYVCCACSPARVDSRRIPHSDQWRQGRRAVGVPLAHPRDGWSTDAVASWIECSVRVLALTQSLTWHVYYVLTRVLLLCISDILALLHWIALYCTVLCCTVLLCFVTNNDWQGCITND